MSDALPRFKIDRGRASRFIYFTGNRGVWQPEAAKREEQKQQNQ